MAEQDRDLLLGPTQFAFIQDGSSANVKVWVGPRVVTPGQSDRLVLWNGKKFFDQPDMNQARQSFVVVTENQYVVLTNPASEDPEKFPQPGDSELAPPLSVGTDVVIRGPATFPLWPGQVEDVIPGHRLSFNEYLVVQVYDPKAAKENEEQAVSTPQTGEEAPATQKAKKEPPREYKMGERLIIRGDERSFYIPQTGIKVLKDENGSYVRPAAVVEQLEYVCLIDESGTKRYEKGPQVVFPEPTETFATERGERKFRAIELSAQSGLHIKVTADYEYDGDGPIESWRGAEMVTVKPGEMLEEGDELFIKGADAQIWFPRAENAVIEYGDRIKKHYAVAIPAGEARYFLDRMGNAGVRRVDGPKMYLPDPRLEVAVRRVLDDKTVNLWYPGNLEALNVNVELASELATSGGDYLSLGPQNIAMASVQQAGSLSRSYPVTGGMAADRIKRGTEHTPTRTITLDTKYQGAPRITVFPGYAVLVMDPTGKRRVVVGDADILMEYHETLMALKFSTGRPKGSGAAQRDVYLRILNNAVGDRITVETGDAVSINIELSLLVNFESDAEEGRLRWFAVEDYVALLTDRVRSRLRNLAKRHNVRKFYADYINLIRDELLGTAKEEAKRPGLFFEENGMRLYDVEVRDAMIADPSVRALLDGAQTEALKGAIEVDQAEEATKRERVLEGLERLRIAEREKTAEDRSAAAMSAIEREVAKSLRALQGALQEAEEEARGQEVSRREAKLEAEQEVALLQERNVVELARATREAELFIQRVNAVDPKLADAIRTYGQQKLAGEIAHALAGQSLLMGTSTAEVLHQRLKGGPLESVFATLAAPAYPGSNGDEN